MAKTCGIRLGRRSFEIVALDGSAKKPRIAASYRGEIPYDADDPWGAAEAALKEGVAAVGAKADEVGLAIDAGMAAFRNVTLPFDDAGKIEQVLKYEVESQLPQWDIDEVIVDFHLLNSTGVESHLLVVAVPKDDLWGPLSACERAGLEAHEAELESTAIVNAAHSAGAFAVDSAEILVHVGESSTCLVVVDGGQVRSMRALHIGALAAPAPEPAPSGGEGEDDAPPVEVVSDPGPNSERRLDEIAARVRREIVRAVTAAHTANPLRAILLCGHALPGLEGDVVQDVPIERLDAIPDDVGDVDGDRDAFAVAYGAALARMGGGILETRLRREELKFTGTFERLELPLAVVAMLLALLFLVQFMVLYKKTLYREGDMQVWLEANNNYLFGVPEEGTPGVISVPPTELQDYALQAFEDVRDGESSKSAYGHLQVIQSQLAAQVTALERRLGRDGAITKPQSALEATTKVLETIDSLGDRVGRFSIRGVTADYRRGTGSRSDTCEVRMDMSFFADSGDVASRHFDTLMAELRAQEWCDEVVEPASKAFDVGAGVVADGIKIIVDTSRIPREANG